MSVHITLILYDLTLRTLHTVPTPTVTILPSGLVQGAMVGSPQVINCTVNTVSGVNSNSVMISWIRPGGVITNDSRVIISPTSSIGNTCTSSLQFAYLMEGDEGTYTCNVMILKTNGSQSVELQSMISKLPLYYVTGFEKTQLQPTIMNNKKY